MASRDVDVRVTFDWDAVYRGLEAAKTSAERFSRQLSAAQPPRPWHPRSWYRRS